MEDAKRIHRAAHLSEPEVKGLLEINADVHLYLYAFLAVAMGTVLGTAYTDWGGNAWVFLHFYMPAILMEIPHLILFDPEYGQGLVYDSLKKTFIGGSRAHFKAKMERQIYLAIFLLAVGILFELGALIILGVDHMLNRIPLVRNLGMTVAAYGISGAALLLQFAILWNIYKLKRLAEKIIREEYVPTPVLLPSSSPSPAKEAAERD